MVGRGKKKGNGNDSEEGGTGRVSRASQERGRPGQRKKVILPPPVSGNSGKSPAAPTAPRPPVVPVSPTLEETAASAGPAPTARDEYIFKSLAHGPYSDEALGAANYHAIGQTFTTEELAVREPIYRELIEAGNIREVLFVRNDRGLYGQGALCI